VGERGRGKIKGRLVGKVSKERREEEERQGEKTEIEEAR